MFPDAENCILCGADIILAPGKCVALIGANGSGKSTLAKTLLGVIPELIPATITGTIQFGDKCLLSTSLSYSLDLLGYTFQDIESQILFGTVEEVLGLDNQGAPATTLLKATKILKVEKLLKRMPDTLSGGEAQKVALLTALRRDPSTIIFDEAVAALDPMAKKHFSGLVKMLTEEGKSVLLLGQNADQFKKVADETLVLDNGRVNLFSFLEKPSKSLEILEFWEQVVKLKNKQPLSIDEISIKKINVQRRGETEFILGPLNFSFHRGECVALVGPNGGGKSTLLSWLAGDLKATSGEFEIDGQKISTRKNIRDIIKTGFVRQNPGRHLIGYDIGEELESSLPNDKMLQNAFFKNLTDHFPFLQIESDPLSLSFGQQRMLTFIREILPLSELLLFDEPEQGIDVSNLQYFKNFVSLNRDKHISIIIFSTHDLALAAELSDRVIMIDKGKILGEVERLSCDQLESWYFGML